MYFLCVIASAPFVWFVANDIRRLMLDEELRELVDVSRVMRSIRIVLPIVIACLGGSLAIAGHLWRKVPQAKWRVAVWLATFACGWIDWPVPVSLNERPLLFRLAVDLLFLGASLCLALVWVVLPVRRSQGGAEKASG
jgi:hypothetical protein